MWTMHPSPRMERRYVPPALRPRGRSRAALYRPAAHARQGAALSLEGVRATSDGDRLLRTFALRDRAELAAVLSPPTFRLLSCCLQDRFRRNAGFDFKRILDQPRLQWLLWDYPWPMCEVRIFWVPSFVPRTPHSA